jgi:hypothetical protein
VKHGDEERLVVRRRTRAAATLAFFIADLNQDINNSFL